MSDTNPWWKVTTRHAGTFFVTAPTKERAIERVSIHSDTVIDAVLRDTPEEKDHA